MLLAAFLILSAAFRDTPRKRAGTGTGTGAGTGSSTPGRYATTSGGIAAEPQLEEAVDESFPVSRSYFVSTFCTDTVIRGLVNWVNWSF